jgi:hypothetical protein
MPDANDLERHTRRGRRDPSIAEAMLEDEGAESLNDYGDNPGDEIVFVGLIEGDTIVAKAAFSADNPLGGESWVTFGATTRQLENEATEAAVERIRDVVTTEVITLGHQLNGQLNQVREEAVATQRSHRISPRQPQQ